MRFCVAISASVRSTSWVSSSGVSFASEVGSISPRHSVRNSTIAAPGGSLRRRRRFGLLDGSGLHLCLPASEPDRSVLTHPLDLRLLHCRTATDASIRACTDAAERSGELSIGNAAAAWAASAVIPL